MACPLTYINGSECKNECVECNERSIDIVNGIIEKELNKLNDIMDSHSWENMGKIRQIRMNLRNLFDFRNSTFDR